ncbi:MAG: serine/threonine-protein phosphatase [Synergistes sp.]|nr:serine/threonine-protein phosphatase [Synergistes sp.]
MKKLIQRRILLVLAGAFLVTFAFAWWLQTELAKATAIDLMRLKLEDVNSQMMRIRENLAVITEYSQRSELVRAHLVAEILDDDPSILKDRAAMERLTKKMDIDQLLITNKKGIVIFSIPSNIEGFDMASTGKTRPFLEAIKNPRFELSLKPITSPFSDGIFKYTGVARFDEPGIILIGYSTRHIESERNIAGVYFINSVSGVRIGSEGFVRILDMKHLSAGELKYIPVKDESEKLFYETLNSHTSLCLSMRFGKDVLVGSMPLSEIYKNRNYVLLLFAITSLIIFILIYILILNFIQRVVIEEISSVNSSLMKITQGNLSEIVDVHETPEFEGLSSGINSTVSALKTLIENEALRIDAELKMGQTIQASVLPKDFPDNETFRLSAGMYTAKEVGGDFYDFFMIDEKHIAFLVADVSGKGLTAALYMMNSKSLIKNMLLSGYDPDVALTAANKELSHNNTACMFVTAFLCVLDINTGMMTCVNAGHNPPMLKHADGGWEYLKLKHSVVLGVSPKARYKNILVQLEPGDRILLYTDGVTEAKNFKDELFGEERLRDFVNTITGTPSEMVAALRDELKNFSDGAEQSDDITILVFDYFGKAGKDEYPTIAESTGAHLKGQFGS